MSGINLDVYLLFYDVGWSVVVSSMNDLRARVSRFV